MSGTYRMVNTMNTYSHIGLVPYVSEMIALTSSQIMEISRKMMIKLSICLLITFATPEIFFSELKSAQDE